MNMNEPLPKLQLIIYLNSGWFPLKVQSALFPYKDRGESETEGERWDAQWEKQIWTGDRRQSTEIKAEG